MGHLAANLQHAGLLMRVDARHQGFTIIEMVVTMVIFALLSALAIPAMSTWIRNVKVRSVADALQNGVRLAQAEAQRRSRPVVFALTTSSSPQSGYTASANGTYWSINTVPIMAGETTAFIQSGVLTTTTSGVGITGPAAICFNSIGRLSANAATTIPGATCTLPTATPPVQTYNIATTGTATANDRPLNVQVALGGQVHMCDPAFTLSSANPEGC